MMCSVYWFIVVAIFNSFWSSYTYCTALQFQYASFHDGASSNSGKNDSRGAIKVVSQDWYNSSVNAYFNGSAIWLTAFQNNSLNGATEGDNTNLGRVIYQDPIQFSNGNASFTTSFTFQIITTRPFPNSSSGMAFFIADSVQAPPNSDKGGTLGLLDPYISSSSSSSFFAVEFDTYISHLFADPSASHIGIDLNTLRSQSVVDTTYPSPYYPQLFLYNNSTFTAWIEYNASTHLTQVWMTNVSTLHEPLDRPLHPCLQLQYDLSIVFSQKLLYMGFSATSSPSKEGMEGHAIYSWSFSNELNVSPVSRPPARRKSKLYVALPVAIAALLLILVMAWLLLSQWRNRNRKRASAGARVENALQSARLFSYKELRKATNGFDERRKVGEGGYGSVYKGILSDGSVVAVKKLRQSLTLEAQFCAEASIVRKVRHRYLLELQGWCYEEGQDALLVTKYMNKGSLDVCLFDASKKKLLGATAVAQTDTRMRILRQVAEALEYLHGGLGECVLHRDVKAGNVLLADPAHQKQVVEARLCDFGLARLIRREEGAVTMTAAGTPGYVAPELLYCGMATDKADVFSFGVLALEVACGRRAIYNDHHIYDWLWSTLDSIDQAEGVISDQQLRRTLDPILTIDGDDVAQQVLQDWRCVVHVGLMCCHAAADCRPSMKEVSRTLDSRSATSFPLPRVKPSSPFEYSPSTTASTLTTTGAASASSDSGQAASHLSAPR